MKQFLMPIVSFILVTFLMTAQQSSYANSLERQFPSLISDNLFLYSSAVLSFDTEAFLNTLPGPLKDYTEELDDKVWSAAEIIDYQAMRYGISPQLILVLLEAQNRLLSDANAEIPKLPFSNRTDRSEIAFYNYVGLNTNLLLNAFYSQPPPVGERSLLFSDGELIGIPSTTNAGTYAVQMTLATNLTRSVWEQWIMGEEPLFVQQYTQWFGDPLNDFDAIESLSTLPQGYILPFTIGETWFFTGGPHHYFGIAHCAEGATRDECPPGPWSSIDIAPPEQITCPDGSYPANRWIVAAKSGEVIESSQALVVIDHNDGWRTYYSHIATSTLR